MNDVYVIAHDKKAYHFPIGLLRKNGGVYYIESKAIGSNKKERIYYIVYRKNGKLIDERRDASFKTL